MLSLFFFFNDTATTEIYTLSLHDALPILDEAEAQLGLAAHQRLNRLLGALLVLGQHHAGEDAPLRVHGGLPQLRRHHLDRKSTRLNSSHANISYAVFCLKKKKYNK